VDGGSNFVGIETVHEGMSAGRFLNVAMQHSIYIWANPREVSNSGEKFSVGLRTAAPVGIAVA